MSKLWIGVQQNRFVDGAGRHVILRGLNVGGDTKVPYPDGGTHHPSDFSDHRTVSFVGRPFPLDQADTHFGRIAGWGFNVMRLLVNWEAVEHAGPGLYDRDFIEHIGQLCERAQAFGLSIFIDFHQDVWSRMSGGSGAPGWVFEKLGLDFRKFDAAGAAHVMQHRYDYSSPVLRQEERYPMMSWALNYLMPVNGIVWTAFFAGATLTPQWLIDGRNVQDYLQQHYFGAVRAMAERVRDLPNVLGFDSLNEPGQGWIGQRLSGSPQEESTFGPPALRQAPAWTPLDGLKVARGLSVSLSTVTGTTPDGEPVRAQVPVNPGRVSIWLPGVADPFEQAGAWKLENGEAAALDEDFFCRGPQGPLRLDRDCMAPFFNGVARTIREVRPDWLLFAEINPHSIIRGGTFPADMPPATVNASHWYDVVLLWSKRFDAGMTDAQRKELKERYRFQLGYLRSLGQRLNGGAPTLIGEFGIPYDVNDGESFKRWAQGERGAGVWEAQSQALALTYEVLDELLLSSTQWNYTASNRNDLRIGDGWNQEDLSVYSDDQRSAGDGLDGGRAVEGFCRPYVRCTQGVLSLMRYDAAVHSYTLEFAADPAIDAPTEIFVPAGLGAISVESSVAVEWQHDAGAQRLSIRATQAGPLKVTLRFGGDAAVQNSRGHG